MLSIVRSPQSCTHMGFGYLVTIRGSGQAFNHCRRIDCRTILARGFAYSQNITPLFDSPPECAKAHSLRSKNDLRIF